MKTSTQGISKSIKPKTRSNEKNTQEFCFQFPQQFPQNNNNRFGDGVNGNNRFSGVNGNNRFSDGFNNNNRYGNPENVNINGYAINNNDFNYQNPFDAEYERKLRVETEKLRQFLLEIDKKNSAECTLNVAAQWTFETNVNEVTQIEAVSIASRFSQHD